MRTVAGQAPETLFSTPGVAAGGPPQGDRPLDRRDEPKGHNAAHRPEPAEKGFAGRDPSAAGHPSAGGQAPAAGQPSAARGPFAGRDLEGRGRGAAWGPWVRRATGTGPLLPAGAGTPPAQAGPPTGILVLAWAPALVLAVLVLLALGRVAGVAASPEQGPLAGTLIVVDPGHGGIDRGACHLPSGTIESEINLEFAFLLRDLLRERGARVLLTRTTDEDLDLDPRIEIANANGADYFLSIHVNWFPDPTCFGAQTFYFPGREESRRLALLVQDELKKVDPENYREIQTGRYRVLRLTRMPGVLVELGFVDSPHDRAILHDPARRRALAEAIVRGVIRHRRGEVGPEPAPDLRDR